MQLGEALSLCKGCHEMYQIEANNTNIGTGKHKMKFQQNNGFGEMKYKEKN